MLISLSTKRLLIFFEKVLFTSFECNDSFIYNLNQFVNEIKSAHEMINTLNDFMLT
jgi:hypothetical protein